MNVALYPRVSTQEQAKEGYSIQEQIDRMESYCKAMNWTVYKVYTDPGFSGASMNRPGLQALIRDVKAGKIDKVLVYKLDRLSRSQKDTLILIDDVFLANNVDFVSMSENFDTSSPFGRAMLGILAVFAQLEREQIKERMTMGKNARAKEGKWHGGLVPIGYNYVDGVLIKDEFEALQIVKAFDMYDGGLSPHKIADELTKQGYSTKYGQWTAKSVRKALACKTYAGLTVHNAEVYAGSHEQIIDQATFERVQRRLKERTEDHEKRNARPGKATSILGGYLRCARCGAKYSKSTRYAKDPVYICNSRNKKCSYLIKDPNCDNVKWDMDTLDNMVLGEIKKLALDPDYLDAAARPDETPVLEAQIDRINDQLSKLMDLYALNSFPVDVLQEKVKQLAGQKDALESEILRIREERENSEETSRIIETCADVVDNGSFDELRAVIGSLIEYIEIDEDITIHWKFS